tara:strand:- start:548 stop:1387 length:840 start_codon:yes stop_codon:yes gene_type:complete
MAEIKRRFLNLEEGQIHYRELGNSSDAAPTLLVMLHASPSSSLSLKPLINALGSYDCLPIYAPDTPGNGDSFKPNLGEPDISYYAEILIKQMEKLGQNKIDVYGTHTGGSIAIELAIQKPELVNKLIVDGIGMYSEEDKNDMLKNYAPEIKPDLMGSQINWAWHFIRDQNFFFPWYKRNFENQRKNGITSPRGMHYTTVELLKSIDSYHHAYRAAFRYPKKQKLNQVNQPILILYEKNDPLYKYKQDAVNASPKNMTEADLNNHSLNDKAKLICDWLKE